MREGAQIVDVRTPAEYAAGHPSQSRNIPLGGAWRQIQGAQSRALGDCLLRIGKPQCNRTSVAAPPRVCAGL
ncbi:MAG TPA: rhodanese-like domain-containing protein [Burkholderiaceae bacterium]|nr:rhodanese-like domain-containing protein [Burkholderiaceae bacterium]